MVVFAEKREERKCEKRREKVRKEKRSGLIDYSFRVVEDADPYDCVAETDL